VNTFYYDAEQHKITYSEVNELEPKEKTMEQLEHSYRNLENGAPNPDTMIAIFQIAGASVNRFLELIMPHVLTPVKILKIFYMGENMHFEEGDIVYIVEPYFYVNKDAIDNHGYNGFQLDRLIAYGCNPMEKGKLYLSYMNYEVLDHEMYPQLFYQGVWPLNGKSFCLSDDLQSGRYTYRSFYDDILHDVQASYGSYANIE